MTVRSIKTTASMRQEERQDNIPPSSIQNLDMRSTSPDVAAVASCISKAPENSFLDTFGIRDSLSFAGFIINRLAATRMCNCSSKSVTFDVRDFFRPSIRGEMGGSVTNENLKMLQDAGLIIQDALSNHNINNPRNQLSLDFNPESPFVFTFNKALDRHEVKKVISMLYFKESENEEERSVPAKKMAMRNISSVKLG